MFKKHIYVVLLRRVFHISRKNFLARSYSRVLPTFYLIVFRGTAKRRSATFWMHKIPPTWFCFRRRKFDCRCTISDFAIFEMCKCFFYILTCFLAATKDDVVEIYVESILQNVGCVDGSRALKLLAHMIFLCFPTQELVMSSRTFF